MRKLKTNMIAMRYTNANKSTEELGNGCVIGDGIKIEESCPQRRQQQDRIQSNHQLHHQKDAMIIKPTGQVVPKAPMPRPPAPDVAMLMFYQQHYPSLSAVYDEFLSTSGEEKDCGSTGEGDEDEDVGEGDEDDEDILIQRHGSLETDSMTQSYSSFGSASLLFEYPLTEVVSDDEVDDVTDCMDLSEHEDDGYVVDDHEDNDGDDENAEEGEGHYHVNDAFFTKSWNESAFDSNSIRSRFTTLSRHSADPLASSEDDSMSSSVSDDDSVEHSCSAAIVLPLSLPLDMRETIPNQPKQQQRVVVDAPPRRPTRRIPKDLQDVFQKSWRGDHVPTAPKSGNAFKVFRSALRGIMDKNTTTRDQSPMNTGGYSSGELDSAELESYSTTHMSRWSRCTSPPPSTCRNQLSSQQIPSPPPRVASPVPLSPNSRLKEQGRPTFSMASPQSLLLSSPTDSATVSPSPAKPILKTRVPRELQAVILASNRGEEVREPPKSGVAFKVFHRKWFPGRVTDNNIIKGKGGSSKMGNFARRLRFGSTGDVCEFDKRKPAARVRERSRIPSPPVYTLSPTQSCRWQSTPSDSKSDRSLKRPSRGGGNNANIFNDKNEKNIPPSRPLRPSPQLFLNTTAKEESSSPELESTVTDSPKMQKQDQAPVLRRHYANSMSGCNLVLASTISVGSPERA